MKNQRQFNNEYVCKTFRKLYLSIWKGAGKTAKQFIDAIHAIDPTAKCDEKYVSKWLNGDMTPVKYLSAIAEVLAVTIDEFIPPKTEHDDRYAYSSEFADGLEKELERRATDDFSLDLTFIKGLRNIISNFDERFPLYTPLTFREGDPDGLFYKRPPAAPASKTAAIPGLFQVNRDGKTYFMSVYDLKILKQVQQKVSKFVTAIFDQTRTRLPAIEAEANAKYNEINNDIWIHAELSDEELQKLDPYGFYTEAKRKKYNIPSEGKIFYEQEDDDDADT